MLNVKKTKTSLKAAVCGFISNFFLKSDQKQRNCLCLWNRAGFVPPTLLSTNLMLIHHFFFSFLSWSLDQATNYSQFFPPVGCFCCWMEDGRRSREGGGNEGVCDWVSPPLCCSSRDKPSFFLSGPALSCLFGADSCFIPAAQIFLFTSI